MYLGIDPLYWMMMAPVLLLSIFASLKVKGAFNKYSKVAGIAVAMTSIIEDLDEWTTWLNHNDFLPLKTADKMVELNKNLSSHLNDIFLHGHFVANDFFETKAKNN